jgi:hypothetical protein
MTRRIVLRLSVSALEEPDEVHALLREEADRAVLEVPGLLASPPPDVRIDTESVERLCATVACTLGGLMHADSAQRELARRLRARLRTAHVDARRGAFSWGLAWRQPVSETRMDTDVSV